MLGLRNRVSDLINGDENALSIIDLIIGAARQLPSSGWQNRI